jgi:hypothetical protein
VLGYIGAHTLQRQRLFINRTELPSRAPADYDTPYNTCLSNISYFCDPQGTCDKIAIFNLFRLPSYIPLDFASDAGGDGILGASAECADCRLRGSNMKPSFW